MSGQFPRKRKRRKHSLTEAQRFWAKVSIADECWEWTASTNRGYGQFRSENRRFMVYAHRWAYEFCVGPIPKGLQLDHLCRNRLCVNPDHLEPVTGRVNVQRGIPRNSKKTECIRGHEFNSENTLFARGKRYCRPCHNAAAYAHRAKKRAEAKIRR